MTGRALIVQGDALRLPLPDESVDLIVTSPPFYQLRQYDAAGIGLEATPQGYLDALLAATREMVRVLKPSGSLFVELGDKYAGSLVGSDNGAFGATGMTCPSKSGTPTQQIRRKVPHGAVPVKSLMGLPWRYALRCVDDLGLILRAPIVWHHTNGLPESVRDRVRMDHSTVFHFTREPRYYAALDTLREPYSPVTLYDKRWKRATEGHNPHRNDGGHAAMDEPNPLGKLPGSVWPIASDPLRLPAWLGVDHYAAFPPELPRRLILGWSPPGVCVECGQGRHPVVDRRFQFQPDVSPQRNSDKGKLDASNRWGTSGGRGTTEATILGWACSCTPFTDHPERRGKDFHAGTDRTVQGMNDGNGGERFRRYQEELVNPRGPVREYHLHSWQAPPTRPAVILDPFSGVGTTCLVARALGRIGIGVDLSHSYSRAARWRVFESGEWQQVIERTTGRKTRPLPKHNPAQPRLEL